jgi:hypothetical protein
MCPFGGHRSDIVEGTRRIKPQDEPDLILGIRCGLVPRNAVGFTDFQRGTFRMDVYGIFGMFCHRQTQRHACKCESTIES